MNTHFGDSQFLWEHEAGRIEGILEELTSEMNPLN